MADQVNDYGLVANDVPLDEVLASDYTRGIEAAVGFKPGKVAENVKLIRGQRKAVVLVQHGHLAEAVSLLESLGVPNAESKVSRLAKRLTDSKAAIEAHEAAIEAQQKAAWEAQVYGNRDTGGESRTAIERLIAADAAAIEARRAMLAAKRKFQSAIDSMTGYNFFGPVVDNDDDGDDDPPAATPPAPIDWRAAVGVEHISGH